MTDATSLISDAQAYADSKDNDARAFINKLADAANVIYDGVVGDVEAYHVPITAAETMIDDLAITFPEIPTIVVPGYTVPAVPTISFTPIIHDITLLEAARSKLLGDLQAGGYGIDVNDETQLLDRERERIVAEAQQTADSVEVAFATRRFSEPPGTMFGAMSRMKESIREAVQLASRNIYIQRATQFFQARQFAVQTAATLDRTRADIIEIQFQIEEARARFALALFQSQLEQFKTQLSAAIDKASLAVRIYEAQATMVDARARISTQKAQVFIAEYQANVQAFLGVMEIRLRNAQNKLAAATATGDARRDAAKAGADFYSTLVAGALGAVNTMVSQSAQETTA
ncbi:MAG: hypothetical protein HY749_16365 [Gammaproteobacteria bacterium]|nr:hypothetical protein [Gammaproteobacteria bacterium]